MGDAWIFILFIVVFAVLAILGYLSNRKRTKNLRWLAEQHDMLFYEEKDPDFGNRFPEFNCLQEGRKRGAYNRFEGVWKARQFIGCDYRYTTGSGKNKNTHHISAVIVSSQLPLKPMIVEPEGFHHRVAEFFGADDIDFESTEFSRKFHVKSPDRKWAFDVFHARTMEFLLQSPVFSLQFHGGHIIAWRQTRFDLSEFFEAGDVIHGILDRMPDYLVQQQRGG